MLLSFLCLQIQNEYKDSGLLYSLHQLQFEEGQLGEGAFGGVHKAKLKVPAGESKRRCVRVLQRNVPGVHV